MHRALLPGVPRAAQQRGSRCGYQRESGPHGRQQHYQQQQRNLLRFIWRWSGLYENRVDISRAVRWLIIICICGTTDHSEMGVCRICCLSPGARALTERSISLSMSFAVRTLHPALKFLIVTVPLCWTQREISAQGLFMRIEAQQNLFCTCVNWTQRCKLRSTYIVHTYIPMYKHPHPHTYYVCAGVCACCK